MQTANGWEYQTANDTVEMYNTLGQLVSIATVSYTHLTLPTIYSV